MLGSMRLRSDVVAALAAVTAALPACGAVSSKPDGASQSSAIDCARTRLSEGLELVVLGSGGPRSAGRAASSYLFALNGTPRIVVDLGPGSFARLGETGVAADRLETVLLTHLHIDHVGDLPALIKSRDLSAEETVSFQIFGPAGSGLYPPTTAFVERLFGEEGAYAYLPSFRNALRIDARDIELDLGAGTRRVYELDGVVVKAVAVDHADVPALAYRLEDKRHSFVVTGDLASKHGQLEELAKDADVLIYDAAILDPPDSPANLYELHTPPRRVGEVAARAGVRRLLLSHIPPKVDEKRDEVLASIRRSFRGEVRFASDCLSIMNEDLP